MLVPVLLALVKATDWSTSDDIVCLAGHMPEPEEDWDSYDLVNNPYSK